MTEEQLKRLYTAMCNDNEHQRNRLYHYIHTNVFSTAEVVQVVSGIVAEATKELREENEGLRADVQNRLNVEVENIELKKQIGKSKELIKKLRALYLSPVVTNDDVKRQDEILNEVKQFLSEVEK